MAEFIKLSKLKHADVLPRSELYKENLLKVRAVAREETAEPYEARLKRLIAQFAKENKIADDPESWGFVEKTTEIAVKINDIMHFEPAPAIIWSYEFPCDVIKPKGTTVYTKSGKKIYVEESFDELWGKLGK